MEPPQAITHPKEILILSVLTPFFFVVHETDR
jgi:hypothetical protein